MPTIRFTIPLCVFILGATAFRAFADPAILTPPTPLTPAIHGPKVFGIHPGTPFL
jgi:hypothetical protein